MIDSKDDIFEFLSGVKGVFLLAFGAAAYGLVFGVITEQTNVCKLQEVR